MGLLLHNGMRIWTFWPHHGVSFSLPNISLQIADGGIDGVMKFAVKIMRRERLLLRA